MHTSIRIAKRAGIAALALGIGGSVATATAAFAAVTANTPAAPTFSVQGVGLASTTLENLNLPVGAKCANPGSASAQYFSFLVPNGTDLTALTYVHNAPQADQGTALITGPDGNGSFLVGASPSNTPPGQIDPHYANALEFGELTDPNGGALTVSGPQVGSSPSATALIPAGQNSADYQAGVVCLDGAGHETDYYSTTVTFTVKASDPHGFSVTIPTPSGGPVVPEAPLAVGLPLGGAAVLVGAAFINRRRRRTQSVSAA